MFGRRERSVKVDQTTFPFVTRQALGPAPLGCGSGGTIGFDVRPPDQFGSRENAAESNFIVPTWPRGNDEIRL